jgi:Terminase RNaseH-like domain
VWPSNNKVRVSLKSPHAEQERFINSRAKRKIIRAGRRSGKTVGVGILAVQRFLAGARILYVAPVLEQTDCFWGEVKRALASAVAEGMFTKSETDRTIEKPDSKQRIKAATGWDPDVLRSDYADLIIFDEWQLQRESMWGEVASPMLLDTFGDAVFIYTPISLHSRTSSRAEDPRHAARMFKMAEQDRSGRWEAFSFSSHANPHISKAALEAIAYDMTALAIKQEIYAQDVDEVPGALWKQADIDKNRVAEHPPLTRIVVAVDPSGSSRRTADECGISICGAGEDGHGYVLADRSGRMSPEVWAATAIAAYHEFACDCILAETNYGGEMVRLTLQTADANVPFEAVTASRGKLIRAEPVSALYQKGRIHHVGTFPELEDQLCSYAGSGESPGRLDSVVWCLSNLMLGNTSLGYLEWLQTKGAAFLAQLEAGLRWNPKTKSLAPAPAPAADPPQPSAATKAFVSLRASTSSCPECGSAATVPANGRTHCNQCGSDFGGELYVTTTGFGPTGMPMLIRKRIT